MAQTAAEPRPLVPQPRRRVLPTEGSPAEVSPVGRPVLRDGRGRPLQPYRWRDRWWPAGVRERFETADKLSDDDRQAIIAIAKTALAPFQPKPDEKTKPTAEPEPKPDDDDKAGTRLKPGSKPVAPPMPVARTVSAPSGESATEAKL